jgi:hypothetical protein
MALARNAVVQDPQEQSGIRPSLNMDVFESLRWKLFDYIPYGQVTDDTNETEAVWKQLIGHPISFEFAAQQPVSSMKVYTRSVHTQTA